MIKKLVLSESSISEETLTDDQIKRKLKDIDTMVYAVNKLTADEYGSLLDNVKDITRLIQNLPEHKLGTTERHINSIYRNFNAALRYLNSVASETDELLNFLTAYGSVN